MSEDVERLRRWEGAGGAWQILGRTSSDVVVALLTCDAGEEVDRLHSTDPALREYVGGRQRNDQDASTSTNKTHEPPPTSS
jgi:hypothetical protein